MDLSFGLGLAQRWLKPSPVPLSASDFCLIVNRACPQGQRASISLKALAEAFPSRPPLMIRGYLKDACDLAIRVGACFYLLLWLFLLFGATHLLCPLPVATPHSVGRLLHGMSLLCALHHVRA